MSSLCKMTNPATSTTNGTIIPQPRVSQHRENGDFNGVEIAASTSSTSIPNNDLRILRNSLKSVNIMPTDEDIRINTGVKPPHYAGTNFWCFVYYYELNERVGEVFKAEWRQNAQGEHPQLLIDGGVCASYENTRYCLGLRNRKYQSQSGTAVRRSIGKGLRLFQRDENIYLECLSDSALFVQCPLLARRSGDELPTVYKLKGNGTAGAAESSEPICLFDKKLFDELLREACTRGYNALYTLQVYCLCRVSFVKGWGQQYRRQTITSCPMWIEVQFPRPLQILDKVLMDCANEIGVEEVHSFS
uniref:MH2 domain-containing protein n=1 Tax=Globodera pallida TaxID=36090 RepID=A0A183CPN8_GLOPA